MEGAWLLQTGQAGCSVTVFAGVELLPLDGSSAGVKSGSTGLGKPSLGVALCKEQGASSVSR